jgi:ferredoxin
MPLHLQLDADRCRRHGACRRLAPEVFGAGADGRCLLQRAVVDGETALSASAAVEACQAGALLAVDEAYFDFPDVGP